MSESVKGDTIQPSQEVTAVVERWVRAYGKGDGDTIADLLSGDPSLSYVGSSLDTGQWEQVLRSVAGARVYSWLNAGQIEARGIVEFVVLDDRFPRSLAFCRNALRECLGALARTHGVEGDAVALMRDADTRISHLTVDEIFEGGLHEFLVDFLARNNAIAQAIAGDYRFHA